jgi:integrase
MELSNFKNWLLVNGTSKSSAEMHTQRVGSFFRHYSELTQENLDSFMLSKLDVWGGSSTNIFINAIKHYMKFLKIELRIPKYHDVDSNKSYTYLTEKEFNDIVKKLQMVFKDGKKAQTILEMMFTTGLRPKEITQLKREDFDFENKVAHVKGTKTHRDRIVALSNSLCKMLQDVFSQEAEQINAFNIKPEGLSYIFNRINQCFSLEKKISPYSMRRCFAHDMISKGIKLTSLQSELGHKNANTTLKYLRVSEQDAVEEIRKLLNKRRKK